MDSKCDSAPDAGKLRLFLDGEHAAVRDPAHEQVRAHTSLVEEALATIRPYRGGPLPGAGRWSGLWWGQPPGLSIRTMCHSRTRKGMVAVVVT